jgi:hypothetical protein
VDKPASIIVRMPPAFRDQLKEAYWDSVGEHRLSYNAWLVRQLEQSLQPVKKSR